MDKTLNLVNKPITEMQSENHQIQIPLDNEVKSIFLNKDLKVPVQVPDTLVDADYRDKQKITDAKPLETRAVDEEIQGGRDLILQVIDQYCTSETAPFNSFEVTECKRMSLYSVANGLKSRWNTLSSLGRLTEDEKKTKMKCIDSILGSVSKSEDNALIEEFLTEFFGENVNFYESCKKRVGIPFDKMESILPLNSGEKYLVLKEPCENFDVYIDDKNNVYPKDSKPNIDSLHLAKTLDRDFKCSEFDGSVYEEVKKAEETETQHFIEKLRHLLEHFIKSSTIREYLGLLIIVRKFFCNDSEIGVLLERDSEDAQFNIYKSSVNDKIRNCFRLGKFREDKRGNLYNIDNLLTIFHKMGHFIAYTLIMGCCDTNTGEDSGNAINALDYGVNSPVPAFTKELVGIHEKDTESWQMINELYYAVWDGKFVEPMQIIGVCQYENSVLLNNYNDFTLLMAMHDINPSIPVFLRNSHGADAVSDENNENENNIPDVIRKFIKKICDAVPHDEVLIKNFVQIFGQVVDGELEDSKNPKKMFYLSFDEIKKIGERVSSEFNLPVTAFVIEIFYKSFVIPTWSDNFVKFFAKLFNLDPKDVNEYIINFDKRRIPFLIDYISKCDDSDKMNEYVGLLEEGFKKILPQAFSDIT